MEETHLGYACEFLKKFIDEVKGGEFRVTISSPAEISETHRLSGVSGDEVLFHIGIRRLGIDNGMDTLFTVDEILNRAVSHTLSTLRSPDN